MYLCKSRKYIIRYHNISIAPDVSPGNPLFVLNRQACIGEQTKVMLIHKIRGQAMVTILRQVSTVVKALGYLRLFKCKFQTPVIATAIFHVLLKLAQ